MKRCISLFLAIVFALIMVSACAPNNPAPDNPGGDGDGDGGGQVENMTKTEKEYRAFTDDLRNLPMNFIYDDRYFSGINPDVFALKSKTTQQLENKEESVYVFGLDDVLEIKLVTAFYKEYNAYEWTVYFSNVSTNKNSAQLRSVNAVDMVFNGGNPHVKGIMGDAVNQYRPYDYDLKEKPVTFAGTSGRATHGHFPYFNVETDDGGAMLAIGWAGTWQADFVCGKDGESTRFTGTGTTGMNTYLKPGETVRTPLIAVVRYYERDEDLATNAWRRWYVDCNMPKESVENPVPVQPKLAYWMALDTGKPNSDGSISEDYTTWKPSLDVMYKHGLRVDIRWFDAGWYIDADGGSPVSDWWGTVGTWVLDPNKWPDDTFRESVEYAEQNGTQTMVWYEPERVTHIDGLVANYGYNREWIISDHGNNGYYLNNIGIPECYEWTEARVLESLKASGAHVYREDFNMDPAIFFSVGDGYQGDGRKGITENLYYQGHYKLWDAIIEYCAENGKSTYVDSCASGGGRNDLESMRRGVPFLRSDSDRTTIALRLAMTTTLVKWLPFTGAMAKEANSQLGDGVMDEYVLRATYLPAVAYAGAFSRQEDQIDWATFRKSQAEYEIVSQYFYKDFYVLTPYRGVGNNTQWTAYQYFDAEKSEGVVQAFRPDDCSDKQFTVQLRGLDPNKMYSVTDCDGVNTIAKVKGSALMNGIKLYAENPRTAIVLMVKAVG